MKTATKSTAKKTTASRKTVKKEVTETLHDIFEDMLKDAYWAEKHLVKALSKLAKASFDPALKQAFIDHEEESTIHVKRLEECFELLGMKPTGKKCEAMVGLVKEGVDALDSYSKGNARDASLIAAAQKAEHYEIASYGTLSTMALVLGNIECSKLLDKSKMEEVQADVKLTGLAERINRLAAEQNSQ